MKTVRLLMDRLFGCSFRFVETYGYHGQLWQDYRCKRCGQVIAKWL